MERIKKEDGVPVLDEIKEGAGCPSTCHLVPVWIALNPDEHERFQQQLKRRGISEQNFLKKCIDTLLGRC